MTTSRTRTEPTSFTSPIIDYEPAPVGALPAASMGSCPPPSRAALHRHTPRPLRPVPAQTHPAARERPPPRAAAVFADTALRRILEVTDRRRPVAQVRPLVVPALFDFVVALSRIRTASSEGAAVLRRVRLRAAGPIGNEAHEAHEPQAAEVFATYTRSDRVRAIAGRIEVIDGRWVVVALQIG